MRGVALWRDKLVWPGREVALDTSCGICWRNLLRVMGYDRLHIGRMMDGGIWDYEYGHIAWACERVKMMTFDLRDEHEVFLFLCMLDFIHGIIATVLRPSKIAMSIYVP